jgi:CheY-like chemotaxis protein
MSDRPTVLLVDDEPGVLDALRLLLEDRYEIVTSRGVAGAMQVLRERRVDLILLDLLLPDAHGLKLFDWLRERGLGVPIIVVSAVDRARTAVEAMQRGAVDYVPKPFDADDLVARVAAVFGGPAVVGSAEPSGRLLLVARDPGVRAALAVVRRRRFLVATAPSVASAGLPPPARADVMVVEAASVPERHEPGAQATTAGCLHGPRIVAFGVGIEAVAPDLPDGVTFCAGVEDLLDELYVHAAEASGSWTAPRLGKSTTAVIERVARGCGDLNVDRLAEVSAWPRGSVRDATRSMAS